MNKSKPKPTIHPEFTFRRSPRYGLDRNNDGIIDLPNSWEYIHNQPSWDPSGCPCLGSDCANGVQFRVYFSPVQNVFQPLQPLMTIDQSTDFSSYSRALKSRRMLRRLEWSIQGPAVPTITATQLGGSQESLEVCLPEGDYTVILRGEDKYTGEWAEHKRKITVEDIFIVQLGDSYASGEGAPETQVRAAITRVVGATYEYAEEALRTLDPETAYIRWQDDGKPYGISTVQKVRVLNAPSDILTNPEGFQLQVAEYTVKLPDYPSFSRPHQEHYRSHRSSFSATSQLALAVENGNDKSSATYVNLAMSGATTNNGIFGSYEGHKGRFHSTSNLMAGQLAQLQDLAGAREIDVLVISIGGNDAGFANAARGLVARDWFDGYQVTLDIIEDGVKTGRWAAIENRAKFFGLALEWSNLLGLNALVHQYEEIKKDLERRGIRARKVYATQYPFFGRRYVRSLKDFIEGRVGSLRYCEQILNTFSPNSAPGGREIDAEELQWARSHVLSRLNDKVEEGAERNGWIFVNGLVTLMDPHGLCASKVPYSYKRYNPHHPLSSPSNETYMRWFRQEDEAAAIENEDLEDATGTLHPNEYGYEQIARRLAEVIAWPAIHDTQLP